MSDTKSKKKMLLHICCAGCGVYVSQVLNKEYDLSLFYYNPNIYPESEYLKREEEIKKLALMFNLKLIISDYNHEAWLFKVKGLEHEKEKGARCMLCYFDRMNVSALYACDHGFDIFTTTLTVSPHKLAQNILRIGKNLSEKYEIEFLAEDFKKKEGFKKASALSRELGLYRQDYCGCEFSQDLQIN
jgi:predicted adenine nucleotide alpha hydrolase (AANH) superfamily ATPase